MENAGQERAIRYFTLLSLLGNTRQSRDIIDYGDEYQSFVQTGTINDGLIKAIGSKHMLERMLGTVASDFQKLPRCYIVEQGSPEYPSQLAQIPNASRFLFLQGDVSLLTRPIVSIVGTRQPSDLGRWRAGKLAALLSRRGVIVASGLAKGIDAATHQGTLLAQGQTVAVLGTPLTQVYPKEHVALQHQIALQG